MTARICLDCTPQVKCKHCRVYYKEEKTDVGVLAQQFVDGIQNSDDNRKIVLVQNTRPPRFFVGFRKRDNEPIWGYDCKQARQFGIDEARQHVQKLTESNRVLLYAIRGEEFERLEEETL